MIVGFDTLNVQPIVAPSAPPPRVQAPIEPVGEREATSRDPQEKNRGERQAGVDFRSYITASTLEGLGRAFDNAGRARGEDAAGDATARPTKVPESGPAILSGSEAADYYRAISGESESLIAAREFRDAATSYAQNFFAATGTFARPGESLELSA